jgi:hypothetical protein
MVIKVINSYFKIIVKITKNYLYNYKNLPEGKFKMLILDLGNVYTYEYYTAWGYARDQQKETYLAGYYLSSSLTGMFASESFLKLILISMQVTENELVKIDSEKFYYSKLIEKFKSLFKEKNIKLSKNTQSTFDELCSNLDKMNNLRNTLITHLKATKLNKKMFEQTFKEMSFKEFKWNGIFFDMRIEGVYKEIAFDILKINSEIESFFQKILSQNNKFNTIMRYPTPNSAIQLKSK